MPIIQKVIAFVLISLFVFIFTLFILLYTLSTTALNPDYLIKELENNQVYNKISLALPMLSQYYSKEDLKKEAELFIKSVIPTSSNPNPDYSKYLFYLGDKAAQFNEIMPTLSLIFFLYINQWILLVVSFILLLILVLTQTNLLDRLKIIAKAFFKSAITLFIYAGLVYFLVNTVLPALVPANQNPIAQILMPVVLSVLNALANNLLVYGIACIFLTLLLYLLVYLLGRKNKDLINKQIAV
ncbi:MAG: hypothetical protein AABW72_04020 [archaeon]